MNLVLLILFVAIQALDVWTTAVALKRGASEANFLPRRLFERFGFWPVALGIKAAIIGFSAWLSLAVSNAWIFTGILVLGGMGVLINNFIVLRRQT